MSQLLPNSPVASENGDDGEEERYGFEDVDVFNIASDDGCGDDDGGDEYDDDSLESLSVNDVIESTIEGIYAERCQNYLKTRTLRPTLEHL